MSILKTQYDSDTDIPAGYGDLFTETGGKWMLTGVEGIKTERDVANVKTALDKERKARQEAEGKIKKFAALGDKDVDALVAAAAEAEELRARVEELESGEGKGKPGDEEAIKARIEREVTKVRGKFERQLTEAQKQIADAKKEADEHRTTATTLDGRIRRGTIESELTRVATGAKVRSEAIADVLALSSIFEVGDDGKPVTRDGVGVTPGLDPQSWLADMKASRPHWWPDSVGGGARGGDGKPLGDNPFDKKAPNLSKAGQLAKTDPARAAALARAAGFASVDAAVKAMADVAAARR